MCFKSPFPAFPLRSRSLSCTKQSGCLRLSAPATLPNSFHMAGMLCSTSSPSLFPFSQSAAAPLMPRAPPIIPSRDNSVILLFYYFIIYFYISAGRRDPCCPEKLGLPHPGFGVDLGFGVSLGWVWDGSGVWDEFGMGLG